jgi:purine-binding chemotaxis protein CheW
METNQSGARPNEVGLSADANQFLTFLLGEEEYGVDILKVQEIKGYVPTTRIPNAPPEVTGVLNLRGAIVPIVDLRHKFGMEPIAYDAFAAIVVVVVHNRVMGITVDRVSEVMNIPAADIQPPSEFSGKAHSQVLTGIGKVGEKLIILLDVESLLSGERGALEAAA